MVNILTNPFIHLASILFPLTATGLGEQAGCHRSRTCRITCSVRRSPILQALRFPPSPAGCPVSTRWLGTCGVPRLLLCCCAITDRKLQVSCVEYIDCMLNLHPADSLGLSLLLAMAPEKSWGSGPSTSHRSCQGRPWCQNMCITLQPHLPKSYIPETKAP